MAEQADPLLKAAPAKAGESAPLRQGPRTGAGRGASSSADLIPLLRAETAQYVGGSDSLDPARGIVAGVLLSALLWVGLAIIL